MCDNPYKDILNYRYPNPETEKDFPDKILRAAQFAPFAALTGHDEQIDEAARLTSKKIELDEYEKEELNRSLLFLMEYNDKSVSVTVIYFVPDERKNGGRYVTRSGFVIRVREYEKDIVLEDDTTIPIEYVLKLEINE